MKNFNILGVPWKILLLGLAKKRGLEFLKGGGDVDTPMHTMSETIVVFFSHSYINTLHYI